MTPTKARRALIGLRIILGTVSYLQPAVAAKAFGIDSRESPAMDSAVRLFGAREAAMALALATRSRHDRTRWIVIGIAVDALDLLTVAVGRKQRRLGSHTVAVGGGMATTAVGLGVRALFERSE